MEKVQEQEQTIEVFENDIQMYLTMFCEENGIEDMTKEPQSRWNSCLRYIYKYVFKSNNNLLKQTDVILPSNIYFGFRKLGVDGFEIIRERICLPETFPEDSPKAEDIYFAMYIISLSEEFIRLYKCIDLKGDDK